MRQSLRGSFDVSQWTQISQLHQRVRSQDLIGPSSLTPRRGARDGTPSNSSGAAAVVAEGGNTTTTSPSKEEPMDGTATAVGTVVGPFGSVLVFPPPLCPSGVSPMARSFASIPTTHVDPSCSAEEEVADTSSKTLL